MEEIVIDIYPFLSGCAMCQETNRADQKKLCSVGVRLETSPWKCRKRQAQEKGVTEHASFEAVREVFDGRVISRGL